MNGGGNCPCSIMSGGCGSCKKSKKNKEIDISNHRLHALYRLLFLGAELDNYQNFATLTFEL